MSAAPFLASSGTRAPSASSPKVDAETVVGPADVFSPTVMRSVVIEIDASLKAEVVLIEAAAENPLPSLPLPRLSLLVLLEMSWKLPKAPGDLQWRNMKEMGAKVKQKVVEVLQVVGKQVTRREPHDCQHGQPKHRDESIRNPFFLYRGYMVVIVTSSHVVATAFALYARLYLPTP